MLMKKHFQWPSLSDVVLYGAPLVFSLVPIFIPGKEAIAGFVILWVGAYWATGCLSLGVTAFIPVVIFAFFEVMTVKEITHTFFFSGLWLFFGSLMLAIAAEATNLHLRVALKTLLFFGTKPKRLLFGFMTTTFVLSMWIPNVVVTAILLPITQGVLEELKLCAASKAQTDEEVNFLNGSDPTEQASSSDEETNDKWETLELTENNEDMHSTKNKNSVISKKMMTALSKSITICIPYSASIGGVATITGTLTNFIGIVLLKTTFPDSSQIAFGTWFFYCAPAAVCTYLASYVWIAWLYFGISHPRTWHTKKSPSKTSEVNHLLLKRVLRKQYNNLGKIRWDEMWVLVVFAFTVILWFTRKPGIVTGWSAFFNERYVNDGTVAMTTALLLFLVPKEKPVFFSSTPQSKVKKSCPKILNWRIVHEKLMWEIIFVIGGGLLVAIGAEKSGLMTLVALNIKVFAYLPAWLVCLCISFFCMIITEFMGNVVAVNLLLPIFMQIAISMRVHPYYICVPVILANSLSFMLPVATLPNAMAYGTGLLETRDMIKTGSVLNIIGLFFIYLSINTYGRFMFPLDDFPVWADIHGNGTASISEVLFTTIAP